MSGCTFHEPYGPLCGRNRSDPIHDATLPRPKGWHLWRDDTVNRQPRPILFDGEEERLANITVEAMGELGWILEGPEPPLDPFYVLAAAIIERLAGR